MYGTLIIILLIGGVALAVYLWWQNKKKKREAIASAYIYYNMALDNLRTEPNDSNKRETALRLGREYADLVRKDKRTMFDEVALMNDLNAIQPTTPKEATDVKKHPVATDSTEQRLTKLEDLRSKGLLTEDEYQNRRSAILDEI